MLKTDIRSAGMPKSGKFLNEEGKEYQKGAVPGSAKLEDKDGNGSITADDKKIIGSKLPSFLLSMGNRFDYKNIYFSFLLNGVFGQTKELHDYNFDRWMPTYNYISGMDYWTPENPTSDIPAATNSSSNRVISSRIIEDGSYLRLKNVTVGYTFPAKLVKKWKIDKARVYVAAQNLWTCTGYSGYDPEYLYATVRSLPVWTTLPIREHTLSASV